MFQDITTLLLDHKAFKDTVDIFVDRYRGMNISVVAGFLLISLSFFIFCLFLPTLSEDSLFSVFPFFMDGKFSRFCSSYFRGFSRFPYF